MAKQFEDYCFKRLVDKFPVPMLKYLLVQYDKIEPYKNKIEINNEYRIFLDYVIEISDNKLFDLEFHSSVLEIFNLGHYGAYKIYLRVDSKKYVLQCILCTADPEKSKRQLFINEYEELDLDIVFTLEDDADEKIEIMEEFINNNRVLTSTDIEIIYLTVALYMKSKLTKSELLFKIADLTNKVKGLTDDELYEIKLFQKAFMKKFISDDDELKGELEKMISINALQVMRETFPEELRQEKEEAMNVGILKTAKTMKDFGDDFEFISKRTGLSIEEIKKL